MKTTRSQATLIVLFAAISLPACADTSPKAVCKHVATLGVDEGKIDKDDMDKKSDRCVDKISDIKSDLGDDGYNKFAKCVLDQSTFSDAKSKKVCNPKDFE